MVKIPPEIALRATIRPGSVYYFRHESFSSLEPHYFVVINIDPTTDDVVLLLCASSAGHSVGTNCPRETFIQIGPSQYPGFRSASVLNCNHVIEQTIEQLVARLSNRTLELKTEMDIRLVEQLRKGVLVSPLVANRIKTQLSTT